VKNRKEKSFDKLSLFLLSYIAFFVVVEKEENITPWALPPHPHLPYLLLSPSAVKMLTPP